MPDPINQLERLWRDLPTMLEQDEDWALKEVLADGVAGYTADDDTPEGAMIRHNPDGTRQLVQIHLDAPDTVVRDL